MRDGFWIFDADRHVVEPATLWRDYLPAAWREHAPTFEDFPRASPLPARLAARGPKALVPLPPMLHVEGRPVYRNISERAWLELAWSARSRAESLRVLHEPQNQVASLDREGIDAALLFPTFALLLAGMDSLSPGLSLELARAYNRWLRDLCQSAPGRLWGAALACPHEPDAMAGEVAWAVENGFRAVVLRPNLVAGRRWSHAAYAPFWDECEGRGVAVILHEGSHSYLPAAGADRFQSRFALHACSHPLEQMMSLLDLIEGGVLAARPALRVALLEAGCGWLPYWMGRLDDEYAHLAGELGARVPETPSAYVRRQCWFAVEPGEPLLVPALSFLGHGRALFGTDFPHLDHDDGLVENVLALRAPLGDAALRALLWNNAASLLKLPPADLREGTKTT